MKYSVVFILTICVVTLAGAPDAHTTMILKHPAFRTEEGLQSDFVQNNFSVTNGRTDVIVSHKPGWSPPFNSRVSYDRNGLAIINLDISEVPALIEDADVLWVEASSRCDPLCDVSVPATGAPSVWTSPDGGTGEGVIVGVLDTGIDIYHTDFRDESGNDRIQAIWDLTVDGDIHPAGYGYGMLWTIDDIIERTCTEEDFYGHGTHVTGIAAGYDSVFMGMAPGADIAVAKAGNYYFYSHNIANGFAWLTDFADIEGKPICINLSLGGGYGPHDGSLLYERVMGNETGPGKIACISAGNSRGNNRHYQFDITPSLSDTLRLEVDPYWSPGALNDYVFISGWYEGDDSIAVSVRSARGHDYGPIHPGDDVLFSSDGDGLVWLDNSSFGLAPNGDRCFTFALCDSDEEEPPASGEWRIIFSGEGTVHGWLYAGSIAAYLFEDDVTNTHIVGPPGTMPEAITVASYATKNKWLNEWGDTSARGWITIDELSSFSSPGPARDGNLKPDITAPGQLIGAARSSSGVFSGWWSTFDGEHTMMQGTSMSSPHVTGAVALLLQADPTLTPDRVRELLASTAETDSFVGSVPNNDWGAGKMNIGAAFDELSAPDSRYIEDGETLPDTAFILISNNYYSAVPHDVSEIDIEVNVLSGNGNLKVRYGEPATFGEYDTSIAIESGINELTLNSESSVSAEGGDIYIRLECLAIAMRYELTFDWWSDYSGNTIFNMEQTALDTIIIEFAEAPHVTVTDLWRWAITAEEDTIAISSATLDSTILTFALEEEIEVGSVVRAHWHSIAELFDSGSEQVETLWPIHQGNIYDDEVWADTTWPHYLGYTTVKAAGSLTIMPGVEIYALDWTSKLVVEGEIEVLGTIEEPVSFGVREPYEHWSGITFTGNRSPRIMNGFSIELADTAINLTKGSLEITGARIRDAVTGILISGNGNLEAKQLLIYGLNDEEADPVQLSAILAKNADDVSITNATFDSVHYAAISIDTVEDLNVVNAIFTRCGAGVDIREIWPAELDYCCFHDNDVDTWGPIDIGANVLYTDPMFIGGTPFDYHLQMGSPCIDSGDPSILDSDDSRSDIGAYGGDFTTIDEHNLLLPNECALRVYPNPFNSVCHLEFFGLSALVEVRDMTGRLVKVIDLNETLTWNGLDSNGSEVPSGVYLFKVVGHDEIVKAILLK